MKLPNYRIAWFELSNGSRMPVAIDVSMLGNIVEANFEKIMQHVIDGWKWEISRKRWTPEQIKNYEDKFYNLKIIKELK